MPKQWGEAGVEGMDVFDPEKHFGGGKQSVSRKKTRKLDDRGAEVVKDTGHYGVDSMPKRPKNKPPTGNKAPGFEKGPKTRF